MRAYATKGVQPQVEKSDAHSSFGRRSLGKLAGPELRQTPAETAGAEPAAEASARFAHDFSSVPVSNETPVRVQPKTLLSAPGDPLEQEADRVARQVLSTSRQPPLTSSRGGQASNAHQTARASREPSRSPAGRVERGGAVMEPSILREAIGSPGRPLDGETLGFMESRFGHDFSRVRVHTDPPSARSAEAVAAHAYTVGSDVVFAPGRYAPASAEGRLLLAHELAHVAQQVAAGAPAAVVQRQPTPDAAPAPTPDAGPTPDAAPAPTTAPAQKPVQAQPAKTKSLKDLGISAQDPISTKTMLPIMDAVFKRNPTIAPYIAGRLAEGREIAGKGKVIVHTTPGTFKDAYEKYIGERAKSVPRGFYWEDETVGKKTVYRDEIHLPPDATFGEAFHEAVHKMSHPSIRTYLADVDKDLAFDLNEGLTSYFSYRILSDEGVKDYRDGYSFKRDNAKKLIKHADFDPVAKWYWQGDSKDLMKKLGVTPGSRNEKKDFARKLKKVMD
jgi:hypothetical protein